MKITNTFSSSRTPVRNVWAAAFAIVCLGTLASVGHAADSSASNEPAKKVVQYGDLNLANPAAVQHLYQRIVSAAQLVCNDRTGPRPIEEQIRTRICIAQSVERAVTAVNSPVLTGLYAAKTGRPSTASTILANRR